MASMSLVFP